MTYINEEIYHVHWLEDTIMLRWQFILSSHIDSMQSQPKPQQPF